MNALDTPISVMEPETAVPALHLPAPADLADADKVLRSMQLMLVNLGKARQQNSAEFKQIMAYYKELGGNLHVVRQKVNEQRQQEAKVKTQLQQVARLQEAGAIGQPRAAYRPPQARAGESLLNKVKQLQQASGVAPVRPAPAAAPTALKAVGAAYGKPQPAAPRPAAPGTAELNQVAAMQQARAAYHSPRAQASPVMVEKLRQLGEQHPEAVVVSPPPEAGVKPAELVAEQPVARYEAPPPELEQLPPGLPLALPRFAVTMGPPYSKAVDKGPPVSNLQQLLTVLGYDVPQTGIYDNKTFQAVQELQLSRQLPVNGLVGLETRKLLNGMVAG